MSDSRLVNTIGHFITVPETVVKMIPKIGGNAFVLFVYLQFRTNRRRHIAFPGYETMRDDLGGWGYSRISSAIEDLEKAGLLERKKRYGKSTIYYIKYPKPPDVGGDNEEEHSPTETVGLDDDSPTETVAQSYQNSSISPTETVGVNQIESNQIESNQTEVKDSSAKPTKDEQTAKKNAVADRFSELTGITVPYGQKNGRVAGKWWIPITCLLATEEIEWDEIRAMRVVEECWERNKRGKKYTVSAPISLQSEWESLLGELRRGVWTPARTEDVIERWIMKREAEDG